jgi:hypothetical protein
LAVLFEPEYKKNTTVSTDPHKHSHILMNMDIDFPNVPCFLLDIGVSTSVNSMDDKDIFESLKFQHVSQEEEVKEQFDGNDPFKDIDLENDIGADKIKDFYDNEYFCKIKGNILVTKVTG